MIDISKKLSDLKAPFPPELISWRVGATNQKKNNGKATKGIALAYLDARDVMMRLDDVMGSDNWQNTHPIANGKTSCSIGIRLNGEWIWKENGAGDSAMDAEKGAFSDSFKRAAVMWGIGRYLYDVPNIWVDLDDYGSIKEPNDSRLLKALEQAAKGIRVVENPLKAEANKIANQLKSSISAEAVEFIWNGHLTKLSEIRSESEQAYDALLAVKSKTIDKFVKIEEDKIPF